MVFKLLKPFHHYVSRQQLLFFFFSLTIYTTTDLDRRGGAAKSISPGPRENLKHISARVCRNDEITNEYRFRSLRPSSH